MDYTERKGRRASFDYLCSLENQPNKIPKNRISRKTSPSKITEENWISSGRITVRVSVSRLLPSTVRPKITSKNLIKQLAYQMLINKQPSICSQKILHPTLTSLIRIHSSNPIPLSQSSTALEPTTLLTATNIEELHPHTHACTHQPQANRAPDRNRTTPSYTRIHTRHAHTLKLTQPLVMAYLLLFFFTSYTYTRRSFRYMFAVLWLFLGKRQRSLPNFNDCT